MGNTTTTTATIEQKFDELSSITDQLALINSVCESNIDFPIEEMKVFVAELQQWDLNKMPIEDKRYYLSHMSFHREIIADIIAEARSLLIEDRRQYLRALVAYYKEFCRWLKVIERNYR